MVRGMGSCLGCSWGSTQIPEGQLSKLRQVEHSRNCLGTGPPPTLCSSLFGHRGCRTLPTLSLRLCPTILTRDALI